VELFVGGCVSLLLALPDLLIVLLLLFAAAHTRLFPLGGMTSVQYSQLGGWTKFSDRLSHLALPVAALALSMLPPLLEQARSSVSEVLGSTFIRAARAHGIPRGRLLLRHALPAAANPLISLLGLSLGTLLSSSLLVEAAFGWPGIGQLLLQATLARDFYVVIDAVMLSAAFLIAGNFLADVLQRVMDPRIRPE
jgi:ABC-type dipeptide/oligopeptide/nickel transport system permease component